MATFVDRRESANNWQDWVNLILAGWLFISPWVLGFAAQQNPSWDAWIIAVVVGVLSIAALIQMQVWEEWINLILGAWLFISPWVLAFASNPTISWNAWIVGGLIFLIAACELSVANQMVDRDRST
jgi:CHASE2 domain-containing sensor protein